VRICNKEERARDGGPLAHTYVHSHSLFIQVHMLMDGMTPGPVKGDSADRRSNNTITINFAKSHILFLQLSKF
jgi:hypothetical protein